MLQIRKFTFNPFQENTYVIYNQSKQCWIIDPGMINTNEELELDKFIENNSLVPQAIINTHTHIDHILGIDYVVNKYSIPFYIHEKDIPILNNAKNTAKMFGFEYNGVEAKPKFISEIETLNLGSEKIEIRLAPGHSPGSIALYYESGAWVISGDVLFREGIGRTDLLLGNHEELINSIRNEIFTLPKETVVYSGHGEETNIAYEKKYNPFLQS